MRVTARVWIYVKEYTVVLSRYLCVLMFVSEQSLFCFTSVFCMYGNCRWHQLHENYAYCCSQLDDAIIGLALIYFIIIKEYMVVLSRYFCVLMFVCECYSFTSVLCVYGNFGFFLHAAVDDINYIKTMHIVGRRNYRARACASQRVFGFMLRNILSFYHDTCVC